MPHGLFNIQLPCTCYPATKLAPIRAAIAFGGNPATTISTALPSAAYGAGRMVRKNESGFLLPPIRVRVRLAARLGLG